MSVHRVDVLRIDAIEPHPNADRLGIVSVFGWRVCVGLSEFKSGDLVAYVPPDSMVDTRRPEFAFLHRDGRDHERIKVKRLRGVYSQGLLIEAPAGAAPGDDVADALAMLRAEPNIAAYGEVFGVVQELKYGLPPGAVDLRLFDLWDLTANRWLSWAETTERIARYALPWVPVIYDGPFVDAAHACGLAEGQSTLAGHVREGAVVRLAVERTDPSIPSQGNRVILKAVGNGYLERA